MTQPLKAIVTAGPTYEPIDPVRFIGNRSSGKQGYAIAQALADAGIEVTLISGPTHLPPPLIPPASGGEGAQRQGGIKNIRVETAQEMLTATQSALPADIAIFTAAVSDWAPEYSDQKIKKSDSTTPPQITLKQNPDILHTIATHDQRPKLVIGFAAETENLINNATQKLHSKNTDWILANDVSQNIFGTDENHVYLITQSSTEEWPRTSKTEIAQKLVEKITEYMK